MTSDAGSTTLAAASCILLRSPLLLDVMYAGSSGFKCHCKEKKEHGGKKTALEDL